MDIFPEYFLYSTTNIKKYGENGHIEYGWSDNLREKILQWNFQAIRCKEEQMDLLESNYFQMINDLFYIYKYRCVPTIDKQISFHLLIILYKMIGQVRDMVEGKGEYAISFRMIYSWYYINQELAFYALECFVKRKDQDHPYGSWRDIKYFCNFILKKTLSKDHPLIKYGIQLLNNQLRQEESKESNESNNPHLLSLVSKWIPREKSAKYGWLNELLAMDYYSHYLKNCSENNQSQLEKAMNKCKMEYRKLISRFNRFCNTIEINQCNKDWASIDFNKVTSIGLWNKSASFLNIKNKSNEDRIVCANNFKTFIEENINHKSIKKDSKMKGENIYLGEFTKRAVALLELLRLNPNNKNIDIQMKILNEQWRDNSKKTDILGKMIAIVDISDTMAEEARNLAIAIGIRIAEKSILGKRIIIFGNNSYWVNLEYSDDFISMVKKIKQKDWSTNANLYSSIDLILQGMVKVQMTPEEIQDLMLVIISDMQIDGLDNNKNELYWEIKDRFQKVGLKYYGKYLKPPHILLWNVRNTDGFPSLYNQENCSMVSGNHPFLLNIYGEGNHNNNNCSLQASTPWFIMIKSLENKRYKILEKKGLELL